MKTLSLILLSFLSVSISFGQDLVGNSYQVIANNAKKAREIQMYAFGDTALQISNNNKERYFKFKFDACNGICKEEEVQFNNDDKENTRIMNQYLSTNKAIQMESINSEYVFETPFKIVMIHRSGNIVRITFKLKNESDYLVNNTAVMDNSGDNNPSK